MSKKKPQLKRNRSGSSIASRKPKPKKAAQTKATLKERLARAKKLEVLDAGKAAFKTSPRRALASQPQARAAHPLRNSDFPDTYIKRISVSLDDPDHWLTLDWTGPNSSNQESGPFRTSPGAGLRGLNCDNEATSRRSGSKCTPKGTYPVQGFQRRLNSDSRATFVTWFMQRRGIAMHYFPIVPKYAASHGCVRIASKHVAQLIQDNSRVERTQVVVSGTWTKPRRQWS
jgi:flagellar hook-length control protein FliK